VSCLQYYRDGALNLRDWLGSYRGIQECAWFAADDIMPFLRMCPSLIVRPLRKIFRKTSAPFNGFRKRFANALAALATGQPAARD
jgi:predicted ATP-grasp superfamily ATP-dependent carboligase